MRIAMLSSISWPTPPTGYGPWEWVTSLLTEALVARGVDLVAGELELLLEAQGVLRVLVRQLGEKLYGPRPADREARHG